MQKRSIVQDNNNITKSVCAIPSIKLRGHLET